MSIPERHPTRRSLLAAGGLIAAGTLGPSTIASAAGPDGYPHKPVRVIVNFPPGSSPDVLARAISQPLQQSIGQPVVIENRAGASGMIGAEAVAKSAADGYTLLMTAGSTITTNPFIYPKMAYDTDRDLVPVAAIARLVLFLVTRPDFPAKDFKEFLAYLKSHPGRVTYGSAGNATGLHLAGEMLKSQAKLYAVHVPYRGASPALQDLLAGQIDFIFDPGIALTHVRAGRLKMLGVASLKRSPAFPDVPTLDEAGLREFDAGTTHGIYAPAQTPPAIVEFLNQQINQALSQPGVRNQIAVIGAEASPMTPAQFAALMKDDSRRYAAIIKERNIRAD
jgi:tripartite-type tricarboxylate transporter receptor subunit TctC